MRISLRYVALSLAVAGIWCALSASEPFPSGAKLVSHVLKRVHDYAPTKDERRLDAIGWARDIREAERLARSHNRPVFLFTHDGNIATGRC